MDSQEGVLVVIEGINGSGKTTIINELVAYYKMIRIPTAVYKFPNRTGVRGDRINRYLKGQLSIKSKYDILDMFAANRKAAEQDIKNDLRSGKIVICDRYVFSAIAYQIPSHVETTRSIANYCNVIGHFDKTMPVPNAIYLIDGNHLHRRGIAHKEVFHYQGEQARRAHKTLHGVISTYTDNFSVLKNSTGYLDETVNYIIHDLALRL